MDDSANRIYLIRRYFVLGSLFAQGVVVRDDAKVPFRTSFFDLCKEVAAVGEVVAGFDEVPVFPARSWFEGDEQSVGEFLSTQRLLLII